MTVVLDQGITIERSANSYGIEILRVCSKGICREAKNEDEAYLFAQHFGWKPQPS